MLRDILIHLDPTPGNPPRLRAAAALAGRTGARLVGLYVIPSDPWPTHGWVPPGAGRLAEARAEDEPELHPFVEHAAQAEREFARTAEAHGVEAYWHQTDGPLAATLARFARTADLVVAGQTPPTPTPGQAPPGSVDETILACGRPVLLVPGTPAREPEGRRMLVAWNGSREAARAVHDALALLREAEAVFTLSVGAPDGPGELPAELSLGAHLRRHGIATRALESAESDVAAALQGAAYESGCDTIVMGAYGHSRLRELVFGGATREMTAGSRTALLLSS